MPAELWTELVQLTVCGFAVAAALTPFGWWALRSARKRGQWLLPRPTRWHVPWGGFEVAMAFVVVAMLVPVLVSSVLPQTGIFERIYGPDFPGVLTPENRKTHPEAATVQSLWIGILAFPLQIGLLIGFPIVLFPHWRKPRRQPGWRASVALAIASWAVLACVVLTVHFGVTIAFRLFEWNVEEHPFAQITASRPFIDQVLFVVQACVAAPLLEEMLFRGLLLPWVLGRKQRTVIVLIISVALAGGLSMDATGQGARGPVLFALALVAGWGIIAWKCPKKRRPRGAIYASAALFAVVHSAVWPSPIPLFVLGLGLGWLALRTRGILVPALVHGLFNLVSVLFVLSGG